MSLQDIWLEFDITYEDIEYSFFYNKNVENVNYDHQLEQYNKKLKVYNVAIKTWKVKVSEYKAELSIWNSSIEKQQIDDRTIKINKLEKELKALKRNL